MSLLGLAWHTMLAAPLARADGTAESKTCSDKLRAAKNLVMDNESSTNLNNPFGGGPMGMQECYDKKSLNPQDRASAGYLTLERNLEHVAGVVDQLYAWESGKATQAQSTITSSLNQSGGNICGAPKDVQGQVKSLDSQMQGIFLSEDNHGLREQKKNIESIKSLFQRAYVDAAPTGKFCDKAVAKNKEIQQQLSSAQEACNAIFAKSEGVSQYTHDLASKLSQCPNGN